MNNKKLQYDSPFDATWTIRAKGRTQVDGEIFVVTAQIIRDILQKSLDDLVVEKKLSEYAISVTVNNLKE